MKAQNFFEYPSGWNEDKVLEKIKPEIEAARELVSAKREIFIKNLLLFNNQKKSGAKDKLGDDLLFRLIDTHMAVAYSNKPIVRFAGRNFAGTDAAATLTRVAKFDWDEAQMEVVNWFTQFDRFMFGVGMKAIVGFDSVRNVPKVESFSPQNWLPDPFGYGSARNFRFMGWENLYAKHEMTEEAGFYQPYVDKLEKVGPQENQAEQARKAAAELSPGISHTKAAGEYELIDWFTMIEGKKYLITVDTKVSMVLRMKEIKPITKAEKKDPSLIPYPVTLHYYFPMRGDPFGRSIPDFAADKQRGRAMLKNLHLALAQAGLYPMYIYDSTRIRNRRQLDYEAGKMIGVAGPVDDTIVRPIPRDPGDINSAVAIEQQLDFDAENAVAINKNMQGGVQASGGTVGENAQIQNNSNLRLLTKIAVDLWGEKEFWKLWRRTYQAEYSSGKEVPIDTAFGENFETINKKVFTTIEDPRIKIEGALEKALKDNRDRAYYNAMYPVLTQDPNIPEISKKIAQRRLLKLNGVPEEDIYVIAPKSEEEVFAENENILLANNEHVEPHPDDDHDTHIVLHSQINTQEARNHILKHMQMKKDLAAQRQIEQQMVQEQAQKSKNIAQQQIGSLAMKDLSGPEYGNLKNITADPNAGDIATSL